MSSSITSGSEVKIDTQGLLTQLVELGASDLHLKAGSPPVLRVSGLLQTQNEYPVMTSASMESAFFEVTTEDQRLQFVKSTLWILPTVFPAWHASVSALSGSEGLSVWHSGTSLTRFRQWTSSACRKPANN